MRRALWILIAAGCGHPPNPVAVAPPDPERPASAVAELVGQWVSTENLDWHMSIDAGGTIDVWVDREKHGRCEQKGTIAPGKTAGRFRLLYTVGGCSPQIVNVPIEAEISTVKGKRLTIVVGSDRRAYEPASSASDDDRERPSELGRR